MCQNIFFSLKKIKKKQKKENQIERNVRKLKKNFSTVITVIKKIVKRIEYIIDKIFMFKRISNNESTIEKIYKNK